MGTPGFKKSLTHTRKIGKFRWVGFYQTYDGNVSHITIAWTERRVIKKLHELHPQFKNNSH